MAINTEFEGQGPMDHGRRMVEEARAFKEAIADQADRAAARAAAARDCAAGSSAIRWAWSSRPRASGTCWAAACSLR